MPLLRLSQRDIKPAFPFLRHIFQRKRRPDHTDDIKTSKDIPSWKRMCYCILKNDHTCRFMGFGLTRQEQNRPDMTFNDLYASVGIA